MNALLLYSFRNALEILYIANYLFLNRRFLPQLFIVCLSVCRSVCLTRPLSIFDVVYFVTTLFSCSVLIFLEIPVLKSIR